MKLPAPEVIAYVAVMVVSALAAHKFYGELKKSHPSEWERLGRPTLGTHLTLKQDGRNLAFLLRRKYSRLGNRRLTFLGDVSLVCWLLLIAGMVIGVLVYDASAFTF